MTRLALVTAVAMSCISAASAAGQASAGSFVQNDNNSTVQCTSIAPGSCNITGSTGTLDVSGSASAALGGPLRIQSTVDATNYVSTACASVSTFCLNGVDAITTASFADVLTITGATTGSTVNFYATLDGSASRTTPIEGENTLLLQMMYGSQTQCFYCLGGNFRADNVSGQTINNTYETSFLETNGQVSIDMFMELSQEVATASSTDVPLNADVTADFSHTALLTGLQVVDANGNDITGQVTITSAEGIVYSLGAPTVTPEPSSLALLLTGIVGVAGAAKRVRRKHDEFVAGAA